MTHATKTPTGFRFTPARVTLGYSVVAALWIVVSGYLLIYTVDDPEVQSTLELLKGLLFVAVTSGLLYLLLSTWRDQARPSETDDARLSRPVARNARWLGLLLGALVLLVPLLGFGIIKVHGPQVEREAFRELRAIGELKADQVANWLVERRRDAMSLALDGKFIEQATALVDDPDEKNLASVRGSLMAEQQAHGYESIELLGPGGRWLVTVDGDGPTHEASGPPLDMKGDEITGRGRLYLDRDGKPHLRLLVPLIPKEPARQAPLGFLLLRVNPLDFLFPYIQRWPTASATGESLLVRRDGDSVVFLNELRHRAGTALRLTHPVSAPQLPAAVALRSEGPGIVSGTDYRGVAVLAAFHPIAGTSWFVVAKVDREEVMAPIRGLVFWITVVSLFAIGALGAALMFLWRQQQQIQSLAIQAERAKADRLLRQFYDLPFIGMAITSPTTKHWDRFNDRLCEILGYPPEELRQLSWAEITHPEDIEADVAQFERVMRGESDGYTMDKRFIRKDGEVVYATIDVKCARHNDGSVDHFVATVQDITGRKTSEIRIRRLTRLYATLSECNQTIVRSDSEEEMFRGICEAVVNVGGFKMAWIGRLDPADNAIRPVASSGEGTEFLNIAQISTDPDSPYGQGPSGIAVRGIEPFWCENFQTDPVTGPWHELASRFGFGALAVLPLTCNRECVGTFNLYGNEPGTFDEEARKLLVELAADVSFALGSFAHAAERRRTEVARQEALSRLQKLASRVPGMVYQYRQCPDGSTTIPFSSEAIQDIFRVTPDEVRDDASRAFAIIHRDDLEGVLISIGESMTGLTPWQHEFRVTSGDGSDRWLYGNALPEKEPGGCVLWHGFITDITERKQAEYQLHIAAKVFERGSEGIVITDPEQRIIMVNQAFTTITGYSEEEVLGKNPGMLASGRHDDDFYRNVWESLQTLGQWQGEIWNRRKDGNIYPEWLSISQVTNHEGRVTEYIGVFSDITRQKEDKERIQKLAYFDPLTGLPNRALLDDRISHGLQMAQRRKTEVALLFMDLDHFKKVNDTLGHRVGDELLIEVANRLKATVREVDTVARQGGDEFILLLPNTNPDGAAHVAAKLVENISHPYSIKQYELTVTPSIGIVMYPGDGVDYATLYSRADIAMYRAKKDGRNRYRFFTEEMQALSVRSLQLETDLRRALALGEFLLHYQPQISLQSGRITGAEVLLRWQHHTLGMVSPGEFISIAEDSGQIMEIGEWVLRTALLQLKDWMSRGIELASLAVNLSAVQFRDARLPEIVASILDETGVAPQYLELELTESVAMEDPESAIRIVNGLREYGVRFSIDDFGTGYSSLNYLKRFNISKLKIDQSFVHEVNTDADDRSIVSGIIGLADNLGMDTIAEGVETEQQLAFLRDEGCEEVQGYLFSRPLAAEAFEAYCRQRRDGTP